MTASLEMEDTDENVRPPSKKSCGPISKTPATASSLCVGCGAAITDKFILRVQPDMEWHARCLRCVKCDRGLHDNNTCFVKDGKTYCKEDYQRLFLQECAACHRSLSRTDYVVHVSAARTYHLSCLKCVVCHRMLHTGDEFALRPHGLLCLQDYQRDSLATVTELGAAAGGRILSLAASAAASVASPVLPSSPKTLKLEPVLSPLQPQPSQKPHSDEDNDSRGGGVNKSAVGGPNCCRSYLDSITADDRLLLDAVNNNNNPATNISRTTSRLSYVKGILDDSSIASDLDDASQDGSSVCGNQSLTDGLGGGGGGGGAGGSLPSTGSGINCSSVGGGGGGGVKMGGHGGGGGGKRSKEQKTTRVRTVLNEKQLHTLRTCYAANPRPDALMKEQLVEMTGLSPRVIRVWFQNKRCKDKKRQIMVKQMDQHQQVGGLDCPLQGVPLVAGSPMRNDCGGGGGPNPIEIQQLPGPWSDEQFGGGPGSTAGGGVPPGPVPTPGDSTPAFQQLISAYHHLSRSGPSLLSHPSLHHPHPQHPQHAQHQQQHSNLSLLSAMGLLSPGPPNSRPSLLNPHDLVDDSPPDVFSSKLIPFSVD